MSSYRTNSAENWYKRCRVRREIESRHDQFRSLTPVHRVAFINSAAGLAQQICEDQGAPGCAQYIGYIQHGLNLIFILATHAHGAVGEGRSGEQSSVENGDVKRAAPIELSGFGFALSDGGYSFDSVEHVDVATLKLDKRDDSDPVLTHRSIFRSLTGEEAGSPSSDVAFNYFDNGDVIMDYAGDMGTLAPDGQVETSGLQKRYAGAGFKISWTSRKRSLLTRAHQNQMSYEIARDWADKAAFLGEGDYIGLVKTDHSANFYFRIIPETKGFGLNYESVNVCGQLAPFL